MKPEEKIKREVLNIIACGKPFGGKNNNDWVCGDFLEEETDEDGRSLGNCYYCEDCHKKADEIIEIMREK